MVGEVDVKVWEAQPGGSYGLNFWWLFCSTFALNFSANLFVLYPLQLVAFGASSTVAREC